MTPIRPKFSNPPLIERAVTVAFQKLDALSLGDYGLFWSMVQDEFPVSESRAPIEQSLEGYGPPVATKHEFKLVSEDVLPRAFFRNPERGELIQLQPDRFSFNWIKTNDGHAYPHSEAVLDRFFGLYTKLVSFLHDRSLGSLIPVQCELTNVNIIPITDVGEGFPDMATVVRLPELDASYTCVRLEDQMIGARHLMIGDDGSLIGRIHTLGQPTLKADTNEPAFRLDVIARGAPLGEGQVGVEAFFDRAVTAVNAVFLASVTKAGRQFWGEI